MKGSVYSRPNKPRRLIVANRGRVAERLPSPLPEPITVDAGTECHVTPEDVAERMVDYLDVDGPVLEPSAGTGNLIQALRDGGYNDITAVERHWGLCEAITARFPDIEPIQGCFLEYALEGHRFAGIVMNPPFRQVRKHIESARLLLAPGGVLVALVPITFNGIGTEIEKLGPDTFVSAKVHTKIVRFEND